MDLLMPKTSTTKQGVSRFATDTETTSGLGIQANDPRLELPINSTVWRVEGDFYPLLGYSGGTPANEHYASGPFVGYYHSPGTANAFYGSVSATDATYGGYQQMDTGTSLGDSLMGISLNDIVRRKYNPKYFMRFSIPTTSTMRLFLGWASGTPIGTLGDDFLNAKSGFGLYVTSGGAFRVGSNDGSGATAFTSSLLAINTSVHTIYLEGDETGARWGYSFDNAAITYITTDTPASTTAMSFYMFAVQTNTAAIRSVRLYNGKYLHIWAA